jgi:uncharacterized protein with GYD domain
MTRTQEIAQVIGQQIGGLNKLAIMTGAKDFVALSEVDEQLGGLKFRIGRGAKKAINTVMIKLMANDTYTVEFWTVRGVKATRKAVAEMVYCEDLMNVVEAETGFFLTLNAR